MSESRTAGGFRVEQLDHVELFVPDRRRAAEWYQRVLGLAVVPGFEQWARDPGGPLMISSDGGNTKLALFEGKAQAPRETAGFHRVAFRVGALDFEKFLARLADLNLTDDRGQGVTADSVVDHQAAYSIYFRDPFGHRLELTTYDHERVKALLARERRPDDPEGPRDLPSMTSPA